MKRKNNPPVSRNVQAGYIDPRYLRVAGLRWKKKHTQINQRSMESQTLIRRVLRMVNHKGHRFAVKNIYLYDSHEADVISVDRYDKIHEFEVKRSRADFRADFEKGDKHWATKNGQMANYFYFVCPKGMLQAYEMPEYAGLIWVHDRGAWIVKSAPELHRDTVTTSKLIKISERMYHTK